MKYFSMFSGIGGFELGIQRASENQCECIGFSEIDKYANATYSSHFPDHKNYGDARHINPDELPEFDLLCGGFPCQSFSIAGQRLGFEDTRGTLFFEIARIAKVRRPHILFLENVKGLLSHDNGRTFATILATLDELGYNAEWEVLNSKHFGVPQNRERVFIIGHLREGHTRQIFPLGADGSEHNTEIREDNAKISGCLTERYYLQGQTDIYIRQLNNPTHSNYRVYGDVGISPSLRTMQGGNGQPKIMVVLTPNREEKRQNGRRFKEDGEEMFTLTNQDIHDVMEGNRIRRLTPIECERLQGFPDNWTLGSDTQRYKQCGNAVTVNVIEAIMQKILYTSPTLQITSRQINNRYLR